MNARACLCNCFLQHGEMLQGSRASTSFQSLEKLDTNLSFAELGQLGPDAPPSVSQFPHLEHGGKDPLDRNIRRIKWKNIRKLAQNKFSTPTSFPIKEVFVE